MTRWKWPIRAVLVLAVLAGAVAVVFFRPDEPQPAWVDCTAPRIQETPPVAGEVESPNLELVREVEDVELPVSVVDLGDRLLVGTQNGLVVDSTSGAPVLDLTDSVDAYSEQGLLGLAMSPEGEWLYVSYIEQTVGELPAGVSRGDLDEDGISRIRSWQWQGGEAVDAEEGVDIFELSQPHRDHNGGGIRFGPDGYLYLGLGDGGGQHLPEPQRARNLGSLFGSIIRIDPTPETGGYEVPADNPFVDDPDAASEILHYGLRNPWRFSFDQEGQLWIADVGHFCVEEIDLAGSDAAGLDFGWPGLEGTYEWALEVDETATPPVYEYPHRGEPFGAACSISGGQRYHGDAIPELQGVYVFADFCAGDLRGIKYEGEQIVEYDLGITTQQPAAIEADRDGELLVLSFEDGGRVSRLVASG